MSDRKWDLSRLSPGERSALKRSAGIMIDDAGMQAVEAFYRAMTVPCAPYAEKAWFGAMCMQCMWREEDHPQVKPFPEILQSMYSNPDATDSMRKRCTGYMDIFWSEDGFLLGKLCSLARKMRAENPSVIPDFEALADDLNRWNNAEHYVQRKWLTIICRANKDETEKNEEE